MMIILFDILSKVAAFNKSRYLCIFSLGRGRLLLNVGDVIISVDCLVWIGAVFALSLPWCKLVGAAIIGDYRDFLSIALH